MASTGVISPPETMAVRVRIRNEYREDLVLVELPHVTPSITVRAFMKLVRAHEEVQAACRPVLLLVASLFRKAFHDLGDPNGGDITNDLFIDQTLSSLGIRDEEDLLMLCTTQSIDDALVRAYEKQEQELLQLRQQRQALARKVDALCHDVAADKVMGGAVGWSNAGKALSDGQTVEIAGKAYTKQQCCIKAVECDPTESFTCNNLGTTLANGQAIEIAGKTHTWQECHVEAVECDPQNSHAWNNLGFTLSNNGETVVIAEKPYAKQQCFVKAVESNVQNADAWTNFGNALPSGQTLEIVGKMYTKQQCYIKAVELNPKVLSAWNNLGNTLSNGQTIEIAAKAFTKQQCFVKAVECNCRVQSSNVKFLVQPGHHSFQGTNY